MAFRQSSFCSSFRAVSFSFSRFMRLGAEEEQTEIRLGVRERYRAAKTRASWRQCNELHVAARLSKGLAHVQIAAGERPAGGLRLRLRVEFALHHGAGNPLQIRPGGSVGSERGDRRVEAAKLLVQPG